MEDYESDRQKKMKVPHHSRLSASARLKAARKGVKNVEGQHTRGTVRQERIPVW